MTETTKETKWETAKEWKPIEPGDYNGLDYGYVVRVKRGAQGRDHEGEVGIAVMFSRFGDIGIKTEFPEKPCSLTGYVFRVQPETLEVLSKFPLTLAEWQDFQKLPDTYKSIDTPQEKGSLYSTTRELTMTGRFFGQIIDVGSMTRMKITGENREKQIYVGEAHSIDHIEHCIGIDSKWIAHPFQNVYQINGKNYAMKVRPVKRDEFFGPNFTLNTNFDDMIEHYVMHGILEFNPNLPVLGAK